jgi:hypothetical protein
MNTIEQMNEMLDILGIDENATLTNSGSYENGFWHNELEVDLEELANGNKNGAFAVRQNIHDTAGISFRLYHGIDKSAQLPDGVSTDAIAELCIKIWENRESYTEGFTVQWDGSNHRAHWDSEPGYGLGSEYFSGQFETDVQDLAVREVWDMNWEDNRDCVRDAVKEWLEENEPAVKFSTIKASKVSEVMGEIYDADSVDPVFTNWEDAAQSVADSLNNEGDEEEEGDEE